MPVFGTSPTDVGTVFDIYSIGDGLFMRRVIDSVAAMSNTGLLIDLFGFSLILGLLIMAFRNVMAGGTKLELGTMLVSVILGFAMFGMKTTVNIHDMNFAPGEVDQPVYVVANVPYGIAAAGWLVSNVGYTLTQKMETAYGLGGGQTTLIEGGFGNTLEWINSIRLWGVAGFNDPANNLGTFRQNLSDYMISCVRPAIEMGHLKLDHLLTTSNIWTWGTADGQGGIGYKSQYLTAHYDDRNPATTDDMITCEDAFNRLNTDRTAMPAAFADAYATSRLDTSTAGHDAQTAMANAFSTIGINGAKMQDLIVAEATGLTLELAIEGQQVSQALNAQSKMMIEQASIQRATQWSAEETMFRRIMRPMMAFFESLMYAVAPFMALMLGLGTYGMQAIGKYLMFSIWVSLWMPVLSIIELFQVTMMQHAVDAMNLGLDHTASGDAAGITMAKTEQLRAMAIDWLGTGAAMAAFTPAITMALVWGGAMTATALAGQMRGGDTVDEKMVAPATSNVGAAVSTMPASNFDRSNGAITSGGMATIPSIDVSSGATNAISLKQQQLEGSMQSAAQTMATVISDAISSQSSVASSRGHQTNGSANLEDTYGYGRNNTTSRSSGNSAGRDVAATDTQLAEWLGGVNAALGFNAAGSGGGVSTSGTLGDKSSSSTGYNSHRGENTAESALAQLVSGYLSRNSLTRSQFAQLTGEQRDAVMRSVVGSKQLQSQLQAFQRSERAYEDASTVQGQYGAHASYSAAYLANQAIQNKHAQGALSAVSTLGSRAQESQNRWYRQLGAIEDSDQRKVAAAIMALYEAQQEGTRFGASAQDASFASDAFMAAVDQRAGANTFFGGGERPENGRNLAAGAPNAADVNNAVDAGMQNIPNWDPVAFANRTQGNATHGPGVDFTDYGEPGSAGGGEPGRMIYGMYTDSSATIKSQGNVLAANLLDPSVQTAVSDGSSLFRGSDQVLMHFSAAAQSRDSAPAGSAQEGHPVFEAARAYERDSRGLLDNDLANLLAVADYMDKNATLDGLPRENLDRAVQTLNTDRGRAAVMIYGDKLNGHFRLERDGVQHAAGFDNRTLLHGALEQIRTHPAPEPPLINTGAFGAF